jgi:hypothetical protein
MRGLECWRVLEFRVGAVEALGPAESVTITERNQRLLEALLVLRAGELRGLPMDETSTATTA